MILLITQGTHNRTISHRHHALPCNGSHMTRQGFDSDEQAQVFSTDAPVNMFMDMSRGVGMGNTGDGG